MEVFQFIGDSAGFCRAVWRSILGLRVVLYSKVQSGEGFHAGPSTRRLPFAPLTAVVGLPSVGQVFLHEVLANPETLNVAG